jgi:hypothetical protein
MSYALEKRRKYAEQSIATEGKFKGFESGKNQTLSIFITGARKPERCLYVINRSSFYVLFV